MLANSLIKFFPQSSEMNDLHGHLISKASEVDQLRVDLAKMEVFL